MKLRFLAICLSLVSVNYAAQGQEARAREVAGETFDERLISCVKNGDADCAARALAAGAKANAADKQGATALSLAAEGKDAEVVRILLDAGADVDGVGEGEGTPLCRAALFGRKEIAEMLLAKKAKINIVCDSNHGDTPLMDALRGMMLTDMPGELKEELGRISDDGGGGEDAENDGSAKRAGEAEKLLEALNAPSDNFLAIARSLLARGADVNVVAKCDAGETALTYAAMGANVGMVKELLSRGADVKKDTSALLMLRHFEREFDQRKRLALPAVSREQAAMFAWGERTRAARAEIKRILKAAGAKEPTAEDGGEDGDAGVDAWEEAALSTFNDVVKKDDLKDFARLVEAYAAHPRGAAVLTEALRTAVIYTRTAMVKLLLERGTDPNPKSGRARGDTPLIRAADDGNIEYVRLLLDAGAEVSVKNDDGRDALDAAESRASSSEEHRAVAELLKARGAKSTRRER